MNSVCPIFSDKLCSTPALVYDASVIHQKLSIINDLQKRVQFDLIYSIKSASFSALLKFIEPNVQGFSTSSWYESKWVREIFGTQIPVHYTSPGISENEIGEISEEANFISFNSWSQYQRFKSLVDEQCQIQIRINPKTDFSLDERYDPCRTHSKLGVSLSEFNQYLLEDIDALNNINGIHIHNNCESRNSGQLFDTVKQVVNELNNHMQKFNYINLGGGYLFDQQQDLAGLEKAVKFLKSNFELDVFFEPGKALVGEAGYLVASVIDLFESDGLMVAVLDTTVNHLPEIFEYQRKPLILNTSETGEYKYRLAGCSCLSGDIFGDYCFEEALQLGSRIVIRNVGAYMFVKANMFNGIKLPDVYLTDMEGNANLIKTHDYDHYRKKLG